MARTKSPKYPNYPLTQAIENVRKVFDADRTSPLPREVIAKHLGYSGLSGASDGNIATLGQYGLLERVGKGEMKVSQLAVDILLPEEGTTQRQDAINKAALSPPLFTEIWNHFEKRLPSEDAIRIYLLRREFNDRAIDPVLKSLAPTLAMMKQQNESESGGLDAQKEEESEVPSVESHSGEVSISIGDYVQWESQGVLQFEQPKRVRWVSPDGTHVAVEGSNTGIDMNQLTPQNPPVVQSFVNPPPFASTANKSQDEEFTEWFRAKVGSDKLVTINFKGEGEIGPKEIQKMIAILEAQQTALED